MPLLLAEDEAHAGNCLLMGLTEGGCVVDRVRSGPHALHNALDAFSELCARRDDPSEIELIRTMHGFGCVMELRR